MATAWENKVLTYKFGWKGFDWSEIQDELNQYGAEGWEVVDTIAPSLGNGQTLEVAIVIKRPSAA
jgi:hypothetical protein